jgi:uncharacterized membrane-anchored protein
MSADVTANALAAPNRVPKVTADFWLVKLLAVTMGETAADYLAVNMGYGLSATSWIMSAVLILLLFAQFAQRKYVPIAYWSAVVMVSVVGTLITDNLVDTFGVPLELIFIGFGLALSATFFVWYLFERTLSIHTIVSTRREVFYWLAILLTFSLGTAAGDLVAEKFSLGYLTTGLMFTGVVAAFWLAYGFGVNAIATFWLAYIFTRPLGASFGDLFSQTIEYGGLGFGTTITSLIFLAFIVATVLYMTLTKDGEEVVAKIGR